MKNQYSFLFSLGTAFPIIIPPVKGTAPHGTMEPPEEPNGGHKGHYELKTHGNPVN